MVVVNEGFEMEPCSRECATECGLDGVAVNERLVEYVLFTGEWLGAVSRDGGCERKA